MMNVTGKRRVAIWCPILAFCAIVLLLGACASSRTASEADATASEEDIQVTEDTTGVVTDTVYVADTSPEIIGGMRALMLHVEYPSKAKKRQLEEKVIVQFVVNHEGKATSFRTLQGEHPILADAVVAALRQVKFKPGLLNDAPINVYMTVPFTFQLQDFKDEE